MKVEHVLSSITLWFSSAKKLKFFWAARFINSFLLKKIGSDFSKKKIKYSVTSDITGFCLFFLYFFLGGGVYVGKVFYLSTCTKCIL